MSNAKWDMRPCIHCGSDQGGHFAGRCGSFKGNTFYTAQADVKPAPTVADSATAPGILTQAAELMAERGKQYDQPQGERSMGRAVAALNAVLGRQALTESEGWLLLQLLKDVRDRQRTAPHPDSLFDGVAYAALKAEARLQETHHG